MKFRNIILGFILYVATGLTHAQSFPILNKAALINSDRFLKESRADIKKANIILSEISKKNGIEIVFQEAVYVDNKIELTDFLIKAMSSFGGDQDLNVPDLILNPIIVAVNSERIFSETKQALAMIETLRAEFLSRQDALQRDAQINPSDASLAVRQQAFTDDLNKRTLELRNKIANDINKIIPEYAKKQGISLVFQNVAYLEPSYDITNDLIQLVNGEISVDQMPIRQNFKKPMRIALVDAEKIFANFDDLSVRTPDEKYKIRVDTAKRTDLVLKNFAKRYSIDLIFQSAAYAAQDVNITPQIISELRNNNNAIGTEKKSLGLAVEDAKKKCSELGFKVGTSEFGKCVLRLIN
jgi:Skp family chaperone for outer membrane proteins